MNNENKKNGFSIKNLVIIIFMIIMLTTVAIVGYIVFSGWVSSANETLSKMTEDMNDAIFDKIDEFIYTPLHVNEVNKELIVNGVVDLTDDVERDKFFAGVLKTGSNDIYSFSYGTETGEYYGARRNENGEIEIMRNNSSTGGNSWYYFLNDDMTAGELTVKAGKFDPRTREWYMAAKELKRPVFSPVYKYFIMNDLTVSAAYPIYNSDGELQGVLGTHIILSKIDSFLREIVEEKNGFALIAEKNSMELVANSLNVDNYTILEDGTFKRIQPKETGDETIIEICESFLKLEEDAVECRYMKLTEYNKEGLEWLVAATIYDKAIMDDIANIMRLALTFVFFVVIISIVVYFSISKRFVNSVESLIDVTEKISRGDLSQRVPVPRNREMGRISKSFNKMADTISLLIDNLEAVVKERTAELEITNKILKENKDHLRLILDSTAEAIYGIDKKGNCTFCNASCLRILGYSHQSELVGKKIHSLIHHSHTDGESMPLDKCMIYKSLLAEKGAYVDNEVFWKADGTEIEVEYYSYPQYKDGEVVGAVITFMDNSMKRRTEEQIKYISSHDSLTGLYNRMRFEEELKKIDTNHNFPISIIFGDVNGLKLTNDVFGHKAGDEFIKKTADILKNVCTEKDIVARVGGDEFIILMPNTELSKAREVIVKLKSELSKAQVAAIKCNVSFGCATKTEESEDIERTMENAENEMYKEKTLNRKNVGSDMINTIISTLHERSPREKRHSMIVSDLCRKIGTAMKLSRTQVKKLEEAGFLHDIGKVVLDENKLNKKSELTEEEIKEMQQDSVIGYRILSLFDFTLDLAEGVYSHNERWDGSGYPKGLKGKEIPLVSRVIAVAEEYDDLTNGELSGEEALLEIKSKSGTKFDPEIVDIFIGIMSTD